MYRSRVVPCLLLKNKGLYKTIKFKEPRYLGDPINTLRLFNDKEVDEIVLLDITASIENRKPNIEYLKKVVSECFMPICYGGGISTIDEVESLFKIGIEKVAFNAALIDNPNLVKNTSKYFGSQSVVASIDVKKNMLGSYSVMAKSGKTKLKFNPVEYAKRAEEFGVGEILLTSINNEGVMDGYDYTIIEKISSAVSMPVVANGGAGSIEDCVKAINCGASAAAASSLFVYYGPRKAVLVNYPSEKQLLEVFNKNLNCTDLGE